MLDPVVIGLLLAVLLHDAFAGLPLVALGAVPVGLLLLVEPALWLLLVPLHRRWGRRVDTTGDRRWLLVAARARWRALLLLVLVHAALVLGFGLLDAVRRVVGNLVLVDEALATLPALATAAAILALGHAFNARRREAALLRSLDAGTPLQEIATWWRLTVDDVRHRFLPILIPVATLGAVAEWLEGMVAATPEREWLAVVGQLTAAAIVIALMPLAVRHLWRTTRLPDGAVRSAVLGLCRRYGVRCADVLVWSTGGAMLNAALVGMLPRFRYILVTDGLLAQLEDEEVEAVLAHEVAHARHHHLPWLVLSTMTAATLAWTLLTRLVLLASPDGPPPWTLAAVTGLVGIVVVASFGIVSRRFEWQADAFAACAIVPGAERVPLAGAEAMRQALRSVARHGRIAEHRASFLHGSIRLRRRRLAALVGTPVGHLPIDATVRWIKRTTFGGMLALAALHMLAGIGVIA